MKNKILLILGILGAIIIIPLIKAKPEPPAPPHDEGWIWNKARWDVNKWF